ncbi:unnamed protein product [Haemonchus placei]|uniref:Transposase n=1 Tax=Haemonchus placei TaxID=6290 RepID=A0A0N4VZJ7_HAEPC|nr:unnamed protein product [Haemonchus placei]
MVDRLPEQKAARKCIHFSITSYSKTTLSQRNQIDRQQSEKVLTLIGYQLAYKVEDGALLSALLKSLRSRCPD